MSSEAPEKNTPDGESQPRIFDQSGRILGQRALNTRRRLLDSMSDLLRENGFRELSVVEIARRSETSPATFYQYFKDINDAVFELAHDVLESYETILEVLVESWSDQAGMDAARRVIEAFADLWERDGHILRVRDQLEDAGHERFVALRFDSLRPILFALAERIDAARESGDVAPEVHSLTAAAAMVTILERLVGAYGYLGHYGASREHLVETCSRILYQALTGRNAPTRAIDTDQEE